MHLNLEQIDLDTYIYRIVSLERLLELFITQKNTLVKPKKWEDSFENFILKSKVQLLSGEVIQYDIHERLYGQCWTLHKSSDAMWRIYSPNRGCVRIRTTINQLLKSLYDAQTSVPEAKCCIGKVSYLSNQRLADFANTIFDDSGISVENIFNSLLAKRKAFKHENEIRLLFDDWEYSNTNNEMYSYKIDPHTLISQIMVDPRKPYSEFKTMKKIIQHSTGYQGLIQRSLLYKVPKLNVLHVTNVFEEKP